jgi:hypothetical protein
MRVSVQAVRHGWIAALAGGVCLLLSPSSRAQVPFIGLSCEEGLSSLSSAASNAATVARRFRSVASDLEDCRSFPGSFDLMRDRCRSLQTDYDFALRRLRSELAIVQGSVAVVNGDCRVAASTPNSGNSMCDLLRAYKGALPDADLLRSCGKSMSDADCKKCLGP